MAIYRYEKIVKEGNTLKAEFKLGQSDYWWTEDELRDIIERIDDGELSNESAVRSEFVKGMRALMIAKDGGLESLINPGATVV